MVTMKQNEILQYICRLISNPISGGTSLGIYGPAGIGKTTLVKDGIAKGAWKTFCFYKSRRM